jgi:hypothetical protein
MSQPNPKRWKCSEAEDRGGQFAERVKSYYKVGEPIRTIRREMRESWEALDATEKGVFVNAYLRKMGNINELVGVIGQNYLRKVLDANIEKIRHRELF